MSRSQLGNCVGVVLRMFRMGDPKRCDEWNDALRLPSSWRCEACELCRRQDGIAAGDIGSIVLFLLVTRSPRLSSITLPDGRYPSWLVIVFAATVSCPSNALVRKNEKRLSL